MTDKPLVSVLMTAYNREKYIAEAIESVITSTYQNWELIIVDDVSKDKTVEISKSYEAKDKRIKVYINETNLGDYPNRNKAASYAKGKYLKYLDSDDILYSHGLETMVMAIEKNPDAVLGLALQKIKTKQPFPITVNPRSAYLTHFFDVGILDMGPSGTILKKEIFDIVGGFSGTNYIGDSELWLKIAAKYPIIIFQPSLLFWRQHDEQEFVIGHTNHHYLELSLSVIVKALESPYCPLNEKEKKEIITYYRKTTTRGIISLAIKEKSILKASFLFRKHKLKIYDIFNAVFRINKKLTPKNNI